MKAKILSFLFILSAALLISTSAFAQPSTPSSTQTSTADPGQTLTYTVGTGSGTWTWSVVQTTGSGGVPTLTANTTNAQSVTWPTNAVDGDVFSLRAYYKDANGCYSEMIAYVVTITKKTLEFTTSGATQNATACSDLSGSLEGGDYTGNEATNVDKVLQNVTYPGANNLATVTYTITAPTGVAGATQYYDSSLQSPGATLNTLTVSNSPSTDKVVDITTNIGFINTTGADITFTVTITGGTTTTGVTLEAGAEKTTTIVVKAKPSIAF